MKPEEIRFNEAGVIENVLILIVIIGTILLYETNPVILFILFVFLIWINNDLIRSLRFLDNELLIRNLYLLNYRIPYSTILTYGRTPYSNNVYLLVCWKKMVPILFNGTLANADQIELFLNQLADRRIK